MEKPLRCALHRPCRFADTSSLVYTEAKRGFSLYFVVVEHQAVQLKQQLSSASFQCRPDFKRYFSTGKIAALSAS